MNPWGPACVIDASVTAMLFLPDPLAPQARQIFDGLLHEPPATLYAPDLLYVECANVLCKHVRRRLYEHADVQSDMAILRSLRIKSYPTQGLVEAAVELAHQFEISAYDACYVALAVQLGAPLVTADRKLAKKVPAKMCEIRVLS